MELTIASSDTEILTDAIAPEAGDMRRELAEAFLRIGFTDQQKGKMHELAEKNNQGVISDAELEQLRSFMRVGNFLNLMQAKARNSLNGVAD